MREAIYKRLTFEWLLDLHVYKVVMLYFLAIFFWFNTGSAVSTEGWPVRHTVFAITVVLLPIVTIGWPLAVIVRLSRRNTLVAKLEIGPVTVCFLSSVLSVFVMILLSPFRPQGEEASNAVMELIEFLVAAGYLIPWIYVSWAASRVLVSVEKGRTASMDEKFRTFLLFIYLPFCIFFLKNRVSRLSPGSQ